MTTEKKEEKKAGRLLKYSSIAILIGVAFYFGHLQYKEYQNADFNHNVTKSAVHQQEEFERKMEERRNVGFVETVKYANAFGDVVGVDYNIIGITKGSSIQVSQEEFGIKSVCFSVITDNDRINLFAPLISVPVYVKFDGGETKTFNATRGSSTFYLCVENAKRFAYNMRKSSKVEAALPFLEYSSHTTKIYEFNLKTFNGIPQ